jgi:chemotaxis protein MotB
MEKGSTQQPIIIKKKKGHGHGHHGGSWKVALADFMTAMMAFFLLMWLLGETTEPEKKAISNYFQDPGSPYVVGPGGADLGLINQVSPSVEAQQDNADNEITREKSEYKDENIAKEQLEELEEKLKKKIEQEESEKLEELKKQLDQAINTLDSVFQQMKDQIIIDYTALGLRIQIVDKDQRPMFDVGKANLKSYSVEALQALAPILNQVPNKISITGHTDATPYGVGAAYTNWELSADRANAARRELLLGGYPEEKVSTVQGMGSAAPFLVDRPTEPINRRIAIIVLKKAVSDALGSGAAVDAQKLIKAADPFAAEDETKILSPTEVDDAVDASVVK